MLQNKYNRRYACAQIDREVERFKNQYAHLWARSDQLLVDAAEVQILVGDDKSALELLLRCFAGNSLIEAWEQAAEETKIIKGGNKNEH